MKAQESGSGHAATAAAAGAQHAPGQFDDAERGGSSDEEGDPDAPLEAEAAAEAEIEIEAAVNGGSSYSGSGSGTGADTSTSSSANEAEGEGQEESQIVGQEGGQRGTKERGGYNRGKIGGSSGARHLGVRWLELT